MKSISTSFFHFLISVSLFSCNGSNKTPEIMSEKKIDTINVHSEEHKAPEIKSVIKLYVSNGADLMGDPCENKVLLLLHGDTLRYVSLNCEDEYSIFNYFSANHVKLTSTGEASLIDNCGGGDPSKIMCLNKNKQKVILSSDSTKLEIAGLTFKASSKKQFFTADKFDVYETSSFKSKVIAKNHKGSYPILSIAKFEKNGKEFGVWYKLLKDDKEVWTFGNAFCTNYEY